MFRIIIYSIALFYTLLSSDHQYPQAWDELQSDEGWELIKETNRVKVFSKEISASPLPAHRTEMISPLDIQTLIKTAWQIEKSTVIFPNAYIIEAGIYQWNGEAGYTAFQLYDIPFMSPRLYQFNSILLENSVHWTHTDTLDRSLNPNNILLPPVNFGSWQVEKYGNESKLIHRFCTDPGGDIPLWIVKMANQRVLPQMILDLETYASEN